MVIPGAEDFQLGQGDHALLMIHGWGSSPRELRDLATSLGDKYFCRAPRLHGHGTTPEDLNQYQWTQHLQQVSEEFSILTRNYAKVSVVGFSYGGTLSIHLSARRRVSNLVLLCPFYQAPIWKGILRPDKLVPYLPNFIKTLDKRGGGPIFNKEALNHHIHYHTMPIQSLKSTVQCAQETEGLLEKVHCPTFIIHSVNDRTASFDGGVHYLKHFGSTDKTLFAVNNSNHVITLDYDRDITEQQVNRWLRTRA